MEPRCTAKSLVSAIRYSKTTLKRFQAHESCLITCLKTVETNVPTRCGLTKIDRIKPLPNFLTISCLKIPTNHTTCFTSLTTSLTGTNSTQSCPALPKTSSLVSLRSKAEPLVLLQISLKSLQGVWTSTLQLKLQDL